MKGYVQVYTGNGKGKTTAAFGLALRAAGAGLKVYIAQFVKGMTCSELEALARFSDLIAIEQFGRDCFVHDALMEQDIQAAQQGLVQVREVVTSGHWDVVILDDILLQLSMDTLHPDPISGRDRQGQHNLVLGCFRMHRLARKHLLKLIGPPARIPIRI